MSRFKTELCNNLIELGNCKYGDRCHYAHGAHELRQVSKRHPKYRTEKCKNFELTGKCPFGPRCSYVHPKPDLDSMIDQLTKYMKHTKAPKPDPEDDENTPLTPLAFVPRVNQPSSSSIAVRTPLGNSNSGNTNILPVTTSSSINNTTSNNHFYQTITPQQNFSYVNNTSSTAPISGNLNNGTCSDNLSIFEPTSFESNKKLCLISQNSSPNYNTTSTTITSASNPFGIYSPLSDIINKTTHANTRTPLQPNKQFYNRF